MANPNKGEYRMQVGEAEYTLRFTTNALCELEDRTNEPSIQWLQKTFNEASDGNIRMKDLRLLFWLGLKTEHPDISENLAGDIMTAVGVPGMVKALEGALTAAFPDAKKESSKNPRKPRGIGNPS